MCSLVGEKNPDLAIEAFVRAHHPAGEPLDALAARLGVSRIIEEPLPFEGGLFQLPHGELIIKLNAKSPFVRQRFTLAHEIGHLLLGKPGLRSSCGDDPDLERACDSIAAELLMPTEDATAFIQSLGQPSPEKLKIIASKYAVSVHATAVRVHAGLGLWKCFIGLWERHPQIKTVWFVGRRRWDRTEPDSYSLDLALSSDTSVQSKELWQKGPSADPVWLNLLRTEAGRVLGLVAFVN
jgi:hypothetical protein